MRGAFMTPVRTFLGQPYPLGATWMGNGVNFAIFSEHASGVELCLLDSIDDAKEDAVRAVVISTNGHPEDKSSWTIAYLEMYSPELKRQMEQAQATGDSPLMGRGLAQSHRFVRRLTDSQWSPLNSPEGERIVTEWARPGRNGVTPVVCAP